MRFKDGEKLMLIEDHKKCLKFLNSIQQLLLWIWSNDFIVNLSQYMTWGLEKDELERFVFEKGKMKREA